MVSTRRLFFALPLAQELRQQIIQWRSQQFPASAGRPVDAENLHVTLAFLGEVDANQEQLLREAAGRRRQTAFTLTLNECGHWPRPGVVWLGARQAPQELLQLAQWLRTQSARNGCYQNPLPFRPHVSLIRQASGNVQLPSGTPDWRMAVDRFCLYVSVVEKGFSRYIPLDGWPLTPRSE
jgi:2'-5' RNA ligase